MSYRSFGGSVALDLPSMSIYAGVVTGLGTDASGLFSYLLGDPVVSCR